MPSAPTVNHVVSRHVPYRHRADALGSLVRIYGRRRLIEELLEEIRLLRLADASEVDQLESKLGCPLPGRCP